MTSQQEQKDLAQTLRVKMKQRNMSAAALARKSGVSIASLSRILSGNTNPSFGNMLKIARVLEIGLDSFTTASSAIQAVETTSSHQQKQPKNLNNHILTTFTLETNEHSPSEAATLLEQAACGTWISCWTETFLPSDLPRPQAIAMRQKSKTEVEIDVAFPHEMVESGSMAGLLSVVGSTLTSTGAKLTDLKIPDILLRTFQGPTFGIRGLRDMMNKYGRPLLSTTLRPMNGLSPKIYGRAIYEALKGGVDFTCDPTLLHNIPGLNCRERFRYAAEAMHTAAGETNEFKSHIANVTAGTIEQTIERAQLAKELELGMILVDSAALGWTGLQSLSNWCHNNDIILCAMGGRSLNGNIMSEQLEAKLLRLVGCDIASIGSPVNGNVSQRRFSIGTVNAMKNEYLTPSPENSIFFEQPFAGFEACMPAVGGGHNPWHFPRLLDALGNDTIIQCGGSVMGHPWGSAAGATANRVAIDALIQARGEGHTLNVDGRNILLKAKKYSPELETALEFWKEESFLFGVISSNTDIKNTAKTLPPKITMLQPITNKEPADE